MNKTHINKSIKSLIKKSEDRRERKDGKVIEHYVVKNGNILEVSETQVDMENFVDAVLDQFSYERFEVYRVVLTLGKDTVCITVNRIVISDQGYENDKISSGMSLRGFMEHGFENYAIELISTLYNKLTK